MPRIDPYQLLKTLGVLLGQNGGIKSSDEVVRLVQLMQKFSKKLVSKCIYIHILRATSNNLLEEFLSERGWELLNQWFSDAAETRNWPLCRAMIQLFSICPVSSSRLRDNTEVNNAPKIINQLKQESSVDDDIKSMAAEISVKWMRAKWVRHVSPANVPMVVDENKNASDNPIDISPKFNNGKRKAEELEENSGILVFHRSKDKRRKSIKWKPESSLVSIRYFELDESERVNVNKQNFSSMRKFEITMEKAALTSKTEIVIDDHEIEKWYKPVPLTYDENSELKPSFTNHGSQSQEKFIQADREKTVLQALYFSLENTPNTPQEPDNSGDDAGGLSDVITKIPLIDKDAEEHDYTRQGWPTAKENKVDNEYAASISSAFHLPPALSNLLASIETKGLESIIPSPTSSKSETWPCPLVPSNIELSLSTNVNSATNLNKPNSVRLPISGSMVNMNSQTLFEGQLMPKQIPTALNPVPGQDTSEFSMGHNSSLNLTKSSSSGAIPSDYTQGKVFDNFNIQHDPNPNSTLRGRISNHRGSYHARRNNYSDYRRASNSSGDFSGARMREYRSTDRRELNFHQEREANRRINDTNNFTRGRSNNICFSFKDRGRCSKGERCGYLHQR